MPCPFFMTKEMRNLSICPFLCQGCSPHEKIDAFSSVTFFLHFPIIFFWEKPFPLHMYIHTFMNIYSLLFRHHDIFLIWKRRRIFISIHPFIKGMNSEGVSEESEWKLLKSAFCQLGRWWRGRVGCRRGSGSSWWSKSLAKRWKWIRNEILKLNRSQSFLTRNSYVFVRPAGYRYPSTHLMHATQPRHAVIPVCQLPNKPKCLRGRKTSRGANKNGSFPSFVHPFRIAW